MLTFGKLVKYNRGRKQYSQSELAKKLNIKLITLQSWEQGVREPTPFVQQAVLKAIEELPVMIGGRYYGALV